MEECDRIASHHKAALAIPRETYAEAAASFANLASGVYYRD